MNLQEVAYYHGSMTRKEAEEILFGKPIGSFLLRKSTKNDDIYVISVVANDKILHYSIEKSPVTNMYSVVHGSEHKTPALVCEHYINESCGLKTKLLFPVSSEIDVNRITVNVEDTTTTHSSSVRSSESYEDFEWFHGTISREEDTKRLSDAYFFHRTNGIFLVRKKTESQFVLSVVHLEKVHRYIVAKDCNTNEFYLDESRRRTRYNSLETLLDYHMRNPPEVTGLKCQLSLPCRRHSLPANGELNKSTRPSRSSSFGVVDSVKQLAVSLAKELKSILPSNSLDVNWSDTSDASQYENDKPVCISRHATLKRYNKKSLPRDSFGYFSPYTFARNESLPTKTLGTNLYINKDKINLMETIGKGHFGCVKFAECTIVNEIIPCAVKILSGDDVEANKQELLSEAVIMQNLDHPYIVRLLAVCDPGTIEGNLMIVLELAPLGSLKNFMRKQNEETFPENKILVLMNQVCEGMSYLSSNNVVHRDLAARNILLVTENFVKISDFGMSKILHDNDYYKASKPGSWPLRWYPPEALLYYRFTSKGDVWSFGVTVWEVCSYGSRPYKGLRGREIVQMLESGKRLQCPNSCSPGLYSLLLQCWAYEPEQRPTFQKLETEFSTLTSE